MEPSELLVARRRLLGEKAAHSMEPDWEGQFVCGVSVARFQMRMVLSSPTLADKLSALLFRMASDFTRAVWPVRLAFWVQVAVSQIRKDRSTPVLARSLPSDVNAMARMMSSCAGIVRMSFRDSKFQRRMVLSPLALASRFVPGMNARAYTSSV